MLPNVLGSSIGLVWAEVAQVLNLKPAPDHFLCHNPNRIVTLIGVCHVV